MLISTKESVAIVICLCSVLVAVVALRAGFNLANVLVVVALVWFWAGRWVSPLPWPGNKGFREIYAMARRGKLKESSVASIISLGAMILMVLYFVAVYQSIHFLR
jgi:hypothetical protein